MHPIIPLWSLDPPLCVDIIRSVSLITVDGRLTIVDCVKYGPGQASKQVWSAVYPFAGHKSASPQVRILPPALELDDYDIS